MTVTAAKAGERKIINFTVMAQTVEGLPVSPVVPAVMIDDSLFDNSAAEEVIDVQVEQLPEAEEKLAEQVSEEESETEHEAVDWLKSSILVLLVNLLLMTAGYFIYKFIKKRELEKQQQLLSKLD